MTMDPKQRYIAALARTELRAAGHTAKQAARLVKLINLEAIDTDDDGHLTGLDTEVDALRNDWPELFDKPQGTPRKRTGETVEDILASLSETEQQAIRISGLDRAVTVEDWTLADPTRSNKASEFAVSLISRENDVPEDVTDLPPSVQRIVALVRGGGNHTAAERLIAAAQGQRPPEAA